MANKGERVEKYFHKGWSVKRMASAIGSSKSSVWAMLSQKGLSIEKRDGKPTEKRKAAKKPSKPRQARQVTAATTNGLAKYLDKAGELEGEARRLTFIAQEIRKCASDIERLASSK